jgi:hypothetical protein
MNCGTLPEEGEGVLQFFYMLSGQIQYSSLKEYAGKKMNCHGTAINFTYSNLKNSKFTFH